LVEDGEALAMSSSHSDASNQVEPAKLVFEHLADSGEALVERGEAAVESDEAMVEDGKVTETSHPDHPDILRNSEVGEGPLYQNDMQQEVEDNCSRVDTPTTQLFPTSSSMRIIIPPISARFTNKRKRSSGADGLGSKRLKTRKSFNRQSSQKVALARQKKNPKGSAVLLPLVEIPRFDVGPDRKVWDMQ
jgi:hypothetical protein